MSREEARYVAMLCEARDVPQARKSRSGCVFERPHGEGAVALFFHVNPSQSVGLQGRELRRYLGKSEDVEWEEWFEPRGGPPAQDIEPDDEQSELADRAPEAQLDEPNPHEGTAGPVAGGGESPSAVEEPTTEPEGVPDASAAVPVEGQEGVEVGQ